MHVLKRIFALCSMLALPAWAVPPASVDAVQMPAWLERNGRVEPLTLGVELRSGDTIRTGKDARAYLKLAEGSTVKLGENARLALFSHSAKPQSVFKGAIDVLTGAFRFTTDALKRVKSRDVTIRVGTATAGIRGTDVWGRSTKKEDLVCLIEGRIEISHGGLVEPIEMNMPLTVFMSGKGVKPGAVTSVSPAQLRIWSRETEIEAGDGSARQGGHWKLRLGTYTSEAEALQQYDIARSEGFAARVVTHRSDGDSWNYDVVLTGYADETEATKTALRLKIATGIEAKALR